MTIVVSDTSPIRALAFVGELNLLSELFGRVVIPPAVARELQFPADRFESINVSDFSFLEVVTPTRLDEVQRLRNSLDAGESEALVLAVELNANLILIDERRARDAARRMNLSVAGIIGVLQRAKNARLVPAIGPILKEIVDGLGFFLSRELVDEILRQEGET